MPPAKAAWAPDRAEIIYIEQRPDVEGVGSPTQPLLVCSAKVFNERTGLVIGLPMTHDGVNADNPFAVALSGPKGEVGYVLSFQPKSFDWRARRAKRHPWGGGHGPVLDAALRKLDAICGICEHV